MKDYPQISFSFKALDDAPDLTLGEADVDIRPLFQKEEGIEYKWNILSIGVVAHT